MPDSENLRGAKSAPTFCVLATKKPVHPRVKLMSSIYLTAPDLGSGRPGPTEIDQQKKASKNLFHSPHFLFHPPISMSPLCFPWFPSLFLPPPQSLNVKEILFSWEAPSGLVGGPLLVGGLGPGPHGPPKSGPDT
jgi:hypothetical protein